MTPEEAAVASAEAVSGLTSRFMLDAATYIYGASLGFAGMSFYTGGRGGVLGDVDASKVTEAFFFFHPDQVAGNWDDAAGVMSRDKAAAEFLTCCSKWGDDHVPDDIDSSRLAGLAEKIATAADGAGAPIFEGWRQLTPPTSPKQAAVFHMNSLRELRFALHAQAVAAQGIAPEKAVLHRQPYMYAMFGWGDLPENPEPIAADWDQAEVETNAAFAQALSALSPDELTEFVALANAATAATA